jgi:hypothetical protein
MKSMKGPFVSVAINKQIAANVPVPLVGVISGEIKASAMGMPLGAVMTGGRVSNVWLSVAASGKDDAQTLRLTGNVYVNGITCLTTQPYIGHVSGEASQHKTTKITGDTGIVQAGMNSTNNVCAAGDMITCDLVLTRTATPTTEMSNATIVVEFEPLI